MTKTIPNRPLYAVAGAADVAVNALRRLPNRLPALAERAESAAAGARSRLSDLSAEVPAELRKLRAELPGEVRKLRDELPERLHHAQTWAEQHYTGLVDRGETAVARLRDGQPEADAVAGEAAPTAAGIRTAGPVAGGGEETPAPGPVAAETSATARKPATGRKPAAATRPATARKTTPRGRSAASKRSTSTTSTAGADDQQPPTGKAGEDGTTA